MFHAMMSGLAAFWSPTAALMALLGTLSGVVVGAMPGLGGVVLLSMILPFLYGMKVDNGLILLLTAHGGIYFSGSATAIMFNTPGAPESTATTFDGYQMTRQGKVARALGISACATTLGGWVGFVCLLALIPAMFYMIKLFQPSEYFSLALLIILLIGQLRARSVSKGMLSGLLGIMVSFVGYDPITGVQRFTFNALSLYDGFNIASVALGLFALSQMFLFYGQERAMGGGGGDKRVSGLFSGPPGARVIDGIRDVFVHWKEVIRSGLVGTLMGMVPGAGGMAATFVSYGVAKRLSKHPERFGQGCPEGIVAPEAAAMAKESGSLVPTVALGVPGTVGMAVVLSGLTILGLTPGPAMLRGHLNHVFTMAYAIGFASLLGSLVGLAAAPGLARVLRVPPWIIVPFILTLSFLGAAVASESFAQVYVVMGFGGVSLVLRRFGYSPATVLIGFVLGPIVEKNLYLALNLQAAAGLGRPLTELFLLISAVMVVWPAIQARRRRRAGRMAGTRPLPEAASDDAHTIPRPSVGPRSAKILRPEILLDAAWLVFAAAYVVIADGYPPAGRLVPMTVGFATMAIGVVHFAGNFIRVLRPYTHGRDARDVSPAEPGEPVSAGGEDDKDAETDGAEDQSSRSLLMAMAWAAGLMLAIPLVGAVGAVFAFFILYFGVRGRRWRLGVISGITMALLTWGLFEKVLSADLPRALLAAHLLPH